MSGDPSQNTFPSEDYKVFGKLTLHGYDESRFPAMFEATAKEFIEELLKTPTELTQIFNNVPLAAPEPTPEDKKALVNNWFNFFDKAFFFQGISQQLDPDE